MERYESYKDSGVEWIGEIPSHWKGYRLRNLGGLYGGLTGKSGDDFKQDDHPMNRPYIPYTNIFRNTYISKEHVDYVVLEEGEKQNRVQQFDLFFLMSSENYDDLGKPCVLVDHVEELYLNSFCKGFRVRQNIVNPLFLNYQLLGDTHRKLVSIEGKGFTRINLRQDRLIDTPMVIPPLHEQEQIVEFLDRKTSLIDSMIEKTEKRIELLKEKRTSLINQVVTKGLNPDVEMKDSGVEWIGEIPNHWGFEKTKTLCETEKKTISVEEFENQKVIHYSIPNVQEFGTGVEELGKDIDSSKLLFSGGEVLVSKLNPRKGCVTRVRFHNDLMVIGSGEFVPLVPRNNLNAEFFHYFIQSPRYSEFLDSNVESVTRSHQRVSPDIIYDLRIPFPPLSEQEKIVAYLDEQTSIIDSKIISEKKRVELLKEYRQSLISEVVTGKVKVS